MSEFHRVLLKQNALFLMDNLNFLHRTFIDSLVQEPNMLPHELQDSMQQTMTSYDDKYGSGRNKACLYFLTKMKCRGPTAFQRIVAACKESQQFHVAAVLEADTLGKAKELAQGMTMTGDHRLMLRTNHKFLLENLILSEEFLRLLNNCENDDGSTTVILGDEFIDDLRTQVLENDTRTRNHQFLKHLTYCGSKAFPAFLNALCETQQNDVVGKLFDVVAPVSQPTPEKPILLRPQMMSAAGATLGTPPFAFSAPTRPPPPLMSSPQKRIVAKGSCVSQPHHVNGRKLDDDVIAGNLNDSPLLIAKRDMALRKLIENHKKLTQTIEPQFFSSQMIQDEALDMDECERLHNIQCRAPRAHAFIIYITKHLRNDDNINFGLKVYTSFVKAMKEVYPFLVPVFQLSE